MSSTYLKYALGVDVSKDSHQVCLSVMDDEQQVKVKASRKFANTLKGFDQLETWLCKHLKLKLPLSIVMEATGVYHEQLAWYLYERGYQLSIVLANKAKAYLKATGLKSKNDIIDARGLSRMGAEQHLPLWQPCSKQLRGLKMLTRHYESLQHTKTSLANQLHALEHAYEPEKAVISSLQRLLKDLDRQLAKTEKQMEALLEKDAALQEKVTMITSSLKGVGTKTVVTLLAETNGFSTIDNQRQLSSYAGYDVVENQSGKRAGKTRISKKGNSHIRRALYMPALNMVRFKVKPFLDLYERIYTRTGIKPRPRWMKAYTAIQRKLLLLIYTLWRKGESYKEAVYTSQSKEAKLLFPPGFEKAEKKVAPSAWSYPRWTSLTLSAEALFPLQQN